MVGTAKPNMAPRRNVSRTSVIPNFCLSTIYVPDASQLGLGFCLEFAVDDYGLGYVCIW